MDAKTILALNALAEKHKPKTFDDMKRISTEAGYDLPDQIIEALGFKKDQPIEPVITKSSKPAREMKKILKSSFDLYIEAVADMKRIMEKIEQEDQGTVILFTKEVINKHSTNIKESKIWE